MPSNEELDRKYKLGRNVSHLLKSDKPPTVVLSVRVSPAEFESLHAKAEATGQRVSDIARDAISFYAAVVSEGHQTVVALPELNVTYYGGVAVESTAGSSSVEVTNDDDLIVARQ